MNFDLDQLSKVTIIVGIVGALVLTLAAMIVIDYLIKRDTRKTVDQLLSFIFGTNPKMAKVSIYHNREELDDILFTKGMAPYRDHNRIVATGYKGMGYQPDLVQVTIGYFEGGKLLADPVSYPLYREKARLRESDRPVL